MQAAVGLGNPGAKYRGTRHNLGFCVVEALGRELGGRWERASLYDFSRVMLKSRTFMLVKPTTYMNRSGAAVAAVMDRFDVAVGEVLVAVDDVHLDVGRLRFRRGGSHGGHNGLRSIIERIGSSDFARLRLGVGQPPEGEDLVEYVLDRFAAGDLERIERSIRTAVDGVRCWVAQGLEETMNRYNAA